MPKKIFDHSIDTDKETLKQFEHCYSQPFVTAAALMPDAHVGYVAPIGAVLETKDYVVPAWVGYDIGCGMTAVKIKGKKFLKLISENKEKIYLLFFFLAAFFFFFPPLAITASQTFPLPST